MDADLYDEFGNYLGPELEDSEADSDEEEEEAPNVWDNQEELNVTTTEPMALDGITGVLAKRRRLTVGRGLIPWFPS